VPDANSRRRFLLGRSQASADDWLTFLAHLRRGCEGDVKLLSDQRARLVPKRLDDVFKARSLCLAHGVCLALDGLALPPSDQARRVLWVEAGAAWGSLMPLGETDCWRVQAGCPIEGMQAAGLIGHQAMDQAKNLAQWFACVGRYPMDLNTLGLLSVEWLFADGTVEVLGTFGCQDSQPLRSLRAQQTVPKLFESVMQPAVEQALAAKQWPWVFRVDALANTAQPNLAHVVVGHGGALGWLIAATFDKRVVVESLAIPVTPSAVSSVANLPAPERPTPGLPPPSLDADVKQIMDPEAIFLSVAPQKG